MTASGLLRERDLRALTAVVEDGLRDDPGGLMPWAVLDRLLELIPADNVQVDDRDLKPTRDHPDEQAVASGGERGIGGPDKEQGRQVLATSQRLPSVQLLGSLRGPRERHQVV